MEPTTQINATLQEMIDHHEIRKLLAVYCHGCDRGDGPRMASVYLDDSWDDHGDFKGSGAELTQRVMNSIVTRGIKCIHLLGQSQINVTGEEAGAETYFLATICDKDENGKEVMWQPGKNR